MGFVLSSRRGRSSSSLSPGQTLHVNFVAVRWVVAIRIYQLGLKEIELTFIFLLSFFCAPFCLLCLIEFLKPLNVQAASTVF